MDLLHHGHFIPISKTSEIPVTEMRRLETRAERHLRGLERAIRPRDEFANFVTHGLGFLLSLAGSLLMMRLVLQTGTFWTILGCATYCASLVMLYAASTLSHAFYDVQRRHFYRKLNQICIFFLIAGSFTPFGAVYLQHGLWPLLTVVIWLLAFLGTGMIWYSGFLSAGAQKIYLLLGWLPAISLPVLVTLAPREVIVWTVLGGLFYTLGTLFLWHDHRVRYFHAMWHTFVIAGSTCQFIAILLMIVTS